MSKNVIKKQQSVASNLNPQEARWPHIPQN